MNIGSICRKLIRSSMGRSLVRNIFPPCGSILMLHHVAEPNEEGIRANEHLKISVDFLEKLIVSFRRNGYTFISMDELLNLLQNKRNIRKVLALTFDDGYKDNLTHAFPLLGSLQIPFTIYLATGLITGEQFCFWDDLARCILNSDSIESPRGETLSCPERVSKETVFTQLRSYFLTLPHSVLREEFFRFLQKNNFIEHVNGTATEMVTVEDIVRYKDDPLLTWGCHSHGHISFAHQSMEFLEQDLDLSVGTLSRCGVSAKHFAFPYGDELKLTPALADLLARKGFLSAVSTQPDLLKSPGKNELFFLPRLFVSQFHSLSGLDGDIATLSLRSKLAFLRKM